MQHYTGQKPTYEIIRNVPALELLRINSDILLKLEREITSEIERAELSLKWIQGLRRIKEAGGQNG